MLELTPRSAPGERHSRVSVFVMEPGGSLWLWRSDPEPPYRFRLLLVPRGQLPRLRNLTERWTGDRDLPLERQTSIDTTQRLTLPAGDADRMREALHTLDRFETNPELPEWKERGYLTKEEAEAVAAEHPEWFPDPDDPDAGPEPGEE